MAIDQNFVFSGMSIGGIIVVLRALSWLKEQNKDAMKIYHESDERRDKDIKLIEANTKHLATKVDLEKTHRIAKHLEAQCTQCKPLTETTAVPRVSL